MNRHYGLQWRSGSERLSLWRSRPHEAPSQTAVFFDFVFVPHVTVLPVIRPFRPTGGDGFTICPRQRSQPIDFSRGGGIQSSQIKFSGSFTLGCPSVLLSVRGGSVWRRLPMRIPIVLWLPELPMRAGIARMAKGGGILIIGGFVLAAAVIGWIRRAPERPGLLVARQASVVCKSPSTGLVRPGDAAHASFQLRNVGGRPVRILLVASGCGCSKPVVRPDLVAPGETAVVEVASSAVPVGKKNVRIDVKTDSQSSPELCLP